MDLVVCIGKQVNMCKRESKRDRWRREREREREKKNYVPVNENQVNQ